MPSKAHAVQCGSTDLTLRETKTQNVESGNTHNNNIDRVNIQIEILQLYETITVTS